MKSYTVTRISFRLWLQTACIYATGVAACCFQNGITLVILISFLALIIFFCTAVLSFPVYVIYLVALPMINSDRHSVTQRIVRLSIVNAVIAMLYAFIATGIFGNIFSWGEPHSGVFGFCLHFLFLFIAASLSLLFNYTRLKYGFFIINPITMEQVQQSEPAVSSAANSNKIITKGFITGVLILVLLIPTFFISNLVAEREARQNQVVTDVGNKWAAAQTISGPYLFIPYSFTEKGKDGKDLITNSHFLLLPETASISGTIKPEQRLRSIYKVLLYKASLQSEGQFRLSIPLDIDPGSLKWSEARICVGLNDFKGIEQLVSVQFNGMNYDLTPGLPTNNIDSLGLSALINLSSTDIGKKFSFSFPLQLKGSKQLHFIPLAGDSHFSLRSEWPSPSFDGNTLPSEREVSERGFSAKWSFNKANLPFGLTLANKTFITAPLAFGVTMVQPADQYAKTERCVKYAILFIGLTFGLFFIIELLQKNPVHPVQYVLVGLALVIFYTLLLSLSEFISFDYAYIMAAASTITLITLYAKGHFGRWGTAFIFGALLTVLYSFSFVLIRLEDTALLIGSIGLFIILSLIMYYSRRIRWYQY